MTRRQIFCLYACFLGEGVDFLLGYVYNIGKRKGGTHMIRIMFVCHGNICRSPMAEMIMKQLVREAGRDGNFLIRSSATSTEEIVCGVGNPIYPPAKAALMRHGIACEERHAVQLTAQDYGRYDLFVGMDSANLRNMQRIFGHDDEGKIRRLMDYTARKGADVSDPWYSDRFDVAYRDIYEGCTGLLSVLSNT